MEHALKFTFCMRACSSIRVIFSYQVINILKTQNIIEGVPELGDERGSARNYSDQGLPELKLKVQTFKLQYSSFNIQFRGGHDVINQVNTTLSVERCCAEHL